MLYLIIKDHNYYNYKEKTVTDIFTNGELEGLLNLKMFKKASVAPWTDKAHFKLERLRIEA